jgi:hypothetical protein
MMRASSSIMLLGIVVMVSIVLVDSIRCRVGVGQRGRMYENGIEWMRECPHTKYCIEVYTGDIDKIRRLFDYPYDDYYNEYYARTCGGDLGTPLDYHPYRGSPEADAARDPHKQLLKIMITTPTLNTGHGSTEEMYVKYICRYDECYENSAPAGARASVTLVLGLVSAVGAILAWS